MPAAFSQAIVVCRHEFRYLLASARTLASMVIYAGFASLSVYGYVAASDRARAAAAEQFGDKALLALDKQSQQVTGQVLQFFGWGTSADSAEMFRDHVPLLVVFFFAIASYFLPLLVALVSFDQFSELSTRGARFSLLRVRRGAYMAGKAVAAVASVAAFLFVMWAVVVGVAIWRDGAASWVHAVPEGFRAWAAMTVLALPYLSLTALISSLARPAFAFLLTLAAWVGMWIGGAIIDHLVPFLLRNRAPDLAERERDLLALFPWRHAPKLISRDGGTLAEGIGALLLLTVIGYALTFVVIRRRDV